LVFREGNGVKTKAPQRQEKPYHHQGSEEGFFSIYLTFA
jgi:hypothetical protein